MTSLFGPFQREVKTLSLIFGLGLFLWVLMVGVLAMAPLNAGETRPGVFALLDTMTAYVDEDGEVEFGPTRLRR
ncbi:MAG: hypothetical protein QNJ84_10290 [Alphaproteobacteria bacterium]|nr:hypothetical protein [Alphaproteobacteria bacterium]